MLDYVRTDGGKFFSKNYGIIKTLYERRAAIATSNTQDIVSIININNSKSINGGGGCSWKNAFAASIGEAIERYCLSSYDPKKLIKSKYSELCLDKPKLEQLNFFSKEQYELYPSLPQCTFDSEMNWVAGKSFVNMRPSAMPASLVYLPYFYTHNESMLSVQLSPGTACHYDAEQATLTALLECIERDAFTLFWEAGIKFPLIPHSQVKLHLQNQGGELRHEQMYCIDITTDINIPVVLTLIFSINERPPFVSIGIAAAMELSQALDKSISEAITSWRSSHEIAANAVFDLDDVMDKLTYQPDFSLHAMYHCFVDTRAHFYALLSDSFTLNQFMDESYCQVKHRSHPSQLLQRLREKLAELAYDFTIVDITTEDIKEHGLHVIRVISCDLVRPTLGLMFRHLNNARFKEVSEKLGLFSYRNSIYSMLNFKVPAP